MVVMVVLCVCRHVCVCVCAMKYVCHVVYVSVYNNECPVVDYCWFIYQSLRTLLFNDVHDL